MVLHPEPRTQGWLSRLVLPHEIICAVTVQKQDFRSKSFLLTQTFWFGDLAVGSGVRAGAALILQVLPCPPVPGHTSQELVLLSSFQFGLPAQCPEDLREVLGRNIWRMHSKLSAFVTPGVGLGAGEACEWSWRKRNKPGKPQGPSFRPKPQERRGMKKSVSHLPGVPILKRQPQPDNSPSIWQLSNPGNGRKPPLRTQVQKLTVYITSSPTQPLHPSHLGKPAFICTPMTDSC